MDKFLLIAVLISLSHVCESAFTFASTYSNHMVLQKGPRGAIVWGKSTKLGDTVHVSLNGHEVAHTNVKHDEHGGLMWIVKVVMNTNNYGPYNLTARSSLGELTLHDVMFGDVWVCSGQSNMVFALTWLVNATEEIQDGSHYHNVRVFREDMQPSNVSLEDRTPAMSWSRPNQYTLKWFSAVCWLFGKQLSSHFQYPIGLMQTNVGGTNIEAWSSPEALSTCPTTRSATAHSSLWNGMVAPLLRNTIYGAIWYQGLDVYLDVAKIYMAGVVDEADDAYSSGTPGEANTYHPDLYSCQFPAMIADWRQKFRAASLHTTSPHFPFGFVQLAANRNGSKSDGFPSVRWAQTAHYGTVPNAKMPYTFMAVAMDLPDFESPHGTIHPRFKHDVASRLVLSALGEAYHQSGLEYQGPYPSNYHVRGNSLNIEYNHGRIPIRLTVNANRTVQGADFEVCCSVQHCSNTENQWQSAQITSHDVSSVTLDTSVCGNVTVSAVRYAWRESPCAFKQCAVYGRDTELPAPPFYYSFH